MAEEFVIRVQVENLQGRSAAPRTGPNAQQERGAASDAQNLIGSANSSTATITREGKSKLPLNVYAREERTTEAILQKAGVTDAQVKRKFGILRRKVDVSGTFEGGFSRDTLIEETALGEGVRNLQNKVGNLQDNAAGFYNEHRARIRASATIAVNSAISSSLAIQAHRSGDSYRNQQAANASSASTNLASIGIAYAIWGPTAGIAFTANFAISTGARMITENANFNFDRRMDTEYIHNVKQVAGNLSYGRQFR